MGRHWSSVVTTNSNHSWTSMHVVRKTSTVNWNPLESHQSLANLLVRGGVDLPALGVTEEVVQGLVTALSAIVGGVVSQVTAVADIIVDRTVRRGLLRSVISVVACVLGMAILRLSGMHLGTMIIVTSCGSFAALSVARVLPTMLVWGS